ncbi:MAG: DUF3990 domain-containing protein [Bifidobacteriaceae bacterium]|nr:DUF3990 domain-containing protein [Bifidobacteriaceae bacterium]
MILHHGSNQAVPMIDLSKCRPFKDFGKGFYLTESLDHARRMAARTARIYGGEPCVSRFEFDEAATGEMSALVFPGPTREWAHSSNSRSDPAAAPTRSWSVATVAMPIAPFKQLPTGRSTGVASP